MESDVTTMKKRIMESKQNEKSMKQTIRLQRDKSRQLITACAFKLQEKEAEVEKVGKYILYFSTNKNQRSMRSKKENCSKALSQHLVLTLEITKWW